MCYSSEIKLAANDPEQPWKTLQNLLVKKPSERTQVPKNLLVDDLIIDDPNIILNNFNEFFNNIGTKLAQTQGETDFNAILKFFLNALVHPCILILPLQPKF